jgi:type I restriction enzyme M protein
MAGGHETVTRAIPDQKIRMPRPKKTTTTAANIGYEAQLWQMADALRGSMDAAE